MKNIAFGLCVVTVILGVLAILSPHTYVLWVLGLLEHANGLWAASSICMLFGIAFITSADQSRTPIVLKNLGSVFVLVGVYIFSMGEISLIRTVNLLIADLTSIRFWGIAILLFGVLIGRNFLPKQAL